MVTEIGVTLNDLVNERDILYIRPTVDPTPTINIIVRYSSFKDMPLSCRVIITVLLGPGRSLVGRQRKCIDDGRLSSVKYAWHNTDSLYANGNVSATF